MQRWNILALLFLFLFLGCSEKTKTTQRRKSPRANAPNVAGDLRTAGIPVTVSDGGGPAILTAAAKGDIDTLKRLIDEGADVNQTNKAGKTALMMAAFNGRLGAVKFLLEKDADVSLKDEDGYTALLYAKKRGKTATVNLLKQAKSIE